MPKFPRWLARKGRLDDARSVLAALEDDTPDGAKVQRAMAEIQQSLSLVTGSLKELTKNGKERILHRTLLAACGQMFQQMCGISALVFYTGTILQNLGFKGDKAKLLGASLTTFQTSCSIILLFLIDKYGHRKLFMITGTGLAICTAVLAGTGSSQSRESSAVNAAVVFIFLFDLFFPMGFLGQTFLYATELAPLRLRVPITAIANATQWLYQFIVAQITPPGTTNLGSRFWIIFAVLNASFVPIVYFFFPETKGRSLEEIDEIFWLSNGFDVVKIARTHKSSSAARPDEESDSVERGTMTGWKATVHQKKQV